MILAQHSDVRNIISKITTDVEEVSGSGTGNASVFDVTQLEGYGLKAIATGDSTAIDITSALKPFCAATVTAVIRVGSASWFNNSQPPVVGTWTKSGTSDTDADVYFYNNGGTWSGSLVDYADVPSGFYWLCFPGTGGTSVKFWYDREKCFDKIAGEAANIYIDQAGCLWLGDPESTGEFICGPTFEEGHKIRQFNLYGNDLSNTTGPAVIHSSTSTIVSLSNGTNEWVYSSVGSSVTYSGFGNGSFDNVTGILFYTADGDWDTFADLPNGLYTVQLPYSDAANGSAITFYYDKLKWEAAFSGNQTSIYIDHLSQIWKGNPESTGTYVCGPYDASENSFFDSRVTALENAETPVTYTTSGNDQDLNYPTTSTASNSTNDILAGNASNQVELWLGGNLYTASGTLGTSVTYTWNAYGGPYGYGAISFGLTGAAWSGPWANFAAATENGLKTFTFPGTMGSFKYYYDADAWEAALSGEFVGLVIAQNGDVFKTSLAPQNLIVDHNGHYGLQGMHAQGILDAPADGTQYARKDNAWEAVASSGGAVGKSGTITTGNTEVTVTFTATQTTDYDRATVSAVGANGGQRQVFIKSAPADNGADLDVVVGIDSSYTEDINVHVVLAKE